VDAIIASVLAVRQRLRWPAFAPLVSRDVLPWFLAALLLVLLRCAPFLLFEQLHFDSDQAVVGLMAKHLIEGRTFPIFFYGQAYMLGVQAWIAAPFFAIGGATIAMLRLPLLIVNVIVAIWLMARLMARGVGAGMAFLATLPFLAPGVLASKLLMEALGASVEPFLYLLLLWSLRRRPIAFGALFAFAYLHREFVLFVLPALAVVWLAGAERGRPTAVQVMQATAGLAAVWLLVAIVTSRINTLGPTGGDVSTGSLVAQTQMIGLRLAWDGQAYWARLTALFQKTLPDLFALRPMQASLLGLNSTIIVGSPVSRVAFLTALAVAALGIMRKRWQTREPIDSFYLYLGVIAIQTALAYALNGGIDPDGPGVARYALFVLLLPIALVGAFAERRPPLVLAAPMAAALVVWAGVNVSDNIQLVREYLTAPPPNNHRVLADYLVSHRIRYGRADYWDAYIVDFLSRERVILAPTAVMRISAYDARVARNAANAVDVVQQPCVEGVRVARWCVDDPLHR
jgi:hypothetical protein